MIVDGKEGKDIQDVKEQTKPRAGPLRTHRDLLVYKQAYRLALAVSELTKTFPRHERYELGSQLRSSSRSVAANIVEGWAKRNSAAEFKRHLLISAGECAESEFSFELSCDEGIADRKRGAELQAEFGKLALMIHNLWKEWRKF